MNCQYCKKPLFKDFTNNSQGGAYDCTHCKITFLMRTNGLPYIISFDLENYQIDLDYSTNNYHTRLFRLEQKNGFSSPHHKLLLRLPHIIPIDPAHKDYWLHKLLNLKVFY